MENKVPILFNKKEECCGCKACKEACPKNAINMFEDEEGFLYPYIDEKCCVGCHQCEKVCPIKAVKVI